MKIFCLTNVCQWHIIEEIEKHNDGDGKVNYPRPKGHGLVTAQS